MKFKALLITLALSICSIANADSVFETQGEIDAYLQGCKEGCKSEACKTACDCTQKNAGKYLTRDEMLEAGSDNPLRAEIEDKINQLADFCTSK